MRLELDQWQKDFLAESGNKVALAGRQTGKSEITSIDASEWAVNNPNKTILMIAPTERQAYELFDKTLNYLMEFYPKKIKMGKDKPTKHEINMVNKTKIYCLPTGFSASGIRGFTIHRLYIEEAARVPRDVFTAVTPMLFTTGGKIILISSAFVSDGYFYEVWSNFNAAYSDFKRFSINSEEVAQSRPISPTWTDAQRVEALAHLQRERARMTKGEYGQEYLNQFSGNNTRYFSEELIKSVMDINIIVSPPNDCSGSPTSLQTHRAGGIYMGADIASMGTDETAISILKRSEDKKSLRMLDLKITEKTFIPDTISLIKDLDNKYDCKRIYIDDGGLGVAVFQALLIDKQTKHKVEAINNSSRSLDTEDKRTKKLDKEVLYANLRRLMEQKAIHLFNSPEIAHSLRSVQCERKENGDMVIYGNYTHITESLTRCAWSIVGDKTLNIWAR